MNIDNYFRIYDRHIAELLSLLNDKDIEYLYNYLEKNGIQGAFRWYIKNNYIADKLLKYDLDEKKQAVSQSLYDKALSVYFALLKAQSVCDMLNQYRYVNDTLESNSDLEPMDIFPILSSYFLDNSFVRICFWPFENHPAPNLSLNLK